ncbi:MAG: hypothetical protein R6V05_14150 [Candidatus Brocadiia bacterium]
MKPVTLHEATDEDLALVRNLVSFYVCDMSEYMGWACAADGRFGGPYDRWVFAGMGTFLPIGDYDSERPNVDVDPLHRPILYLRGDPHYVPLKQAAGPAE